MAMKRKAALFLLVVLGLLIGACGQPIGTACQISGSGFHAKDPCANKCLSRWAVNCPDGSRLTPNVCTGKKDCTPGSCPQGQACYSFDDPFDERSYCIPESACGSPLSAGQRLRWEEDSANTAAQMRARYEAAVSAGSRRPAAPRSRPCAGLTPWRPWPKAISPRRRDSSSGDFYTVHVHTRVEDLRAAEGPDGVSAETPRREACDCCVVHWLENERGQALDVGRRRRNEDRQP